MTTPTSVYYVTGFRNQDNTHGVWEGFHYRETDFTGADFLHGQFTDCIFSNCDFTGVRFDLARFQNVQFSTNNRVAPNLGVAKGPRYRPIWP